MPSGHSAGKVYSIFGIAPTVMNNHSLGIKILNHIREGVYNLC